LKGWTGVNIEPIEKWYLQFLDKRPKDINLNIGVSNVEDTLEFYRIFSDVDKKEDTLSTFNKEILESSIKQGFTSYETIKIPVTTLNKVLEKNNIQDIDFLKIDVEGTEREVLMGIDLKKYRPKVFVIEATEPNGPIPNDYLWKDLMVDNNYIFVLNDGLNHYYIAREHYKKLIPKFIDAFNCAVKSNYKYHILNHPMLFSYPYDSNL
jgi:FkbM family methyltransferase